MKPSIYRYIALQFLIFFATPNCYAQTLIQKKYYSSSIGDSVPVKIWLPKNYDAAQRYPVIYEMVYDHSNFIASTVDNIFEIPSCIVVFSEMKNSSNGSVYYSKPDLPEKEQKFYGFLKNELMNIISRQYKTSKFNIVVGLSQGADFTSHFLKNDPEMFDAYLFFSIEKPSYSPDFNTYISKIKAKKKLYLAIAGDDLDYRKLFASSLYDSLIKSPLIDIKRKVYQDVQHQYSILNGLSDGLLFAFQDYNIPRPRLLDETFTAYYQNVLTEKQERYGSINMNNFLIEITKKIDSTTFSDRSATDFFNILYSSTQITALDLANLGYSLRKKKLFSYAENAYDFALRKTGEIKASQSIDSLTIYLQKSLIYTDQNKHDKAVQLLEYLYKQYRDPYVLFRLGSYYIDKKMELKKGIKILKSISELGSIGHTRVITEDQIYSKLAKGFWEFQDRLNAINYINKALKINSQNTEARDLLKLIKRQ